MIRINEELCCYCGSCVAVCPQNIIELVDTYVKFFHEKCTQCARCVKGCPIGALRITNAEGSAKRDSTAYEGAKQICGVSKSTFP